MSDNNFIRIKIKFIKTFLSPNHMKATFLSIDHSHPYCHTNHITHKLRVNETTHTLSLSLSLYIYIYIYIYIHTLYPTKLHVKMNHHDSLVGEVAITFTYTKNYYKPKRKKKKKKVVVVVVECYNCKHTPRDTGSFPPALHNKVRVSLHKMIKATA